MFLETWEDLLSLRLQWKTKVRKNQKNVTCIILRRSPFLPSRVYSCTLFALLSCILIIKGFRTIVFIFIVISTTFRSICPPASFRCLSNSGTFIEHRTTSFIESTGVACSDSVSHHRVQVLSIPVFLQWNNAYNRYAMCPAGQFNKLRLRNLDNYAAFVITWLFHLCHYINNTWYPPANNQLFVLI